MVPSANGWTAHKLDQLGFVGRGRSRHRPRNEPSLYGGQYPFFQTGDIKAADLYLSKYRQTYNERGLAQSKLWKPGTLCITIAANIAETAILAIEGCFPDSIVGFVPDPEKADARFIKYSIDVMKLRMQNISRGTTQDNLSVDKLLSFDFIVPPVATQARIAHVLAAYDDLIQNNTRRINILEEIAQALYREWFVHFRFLGHETVKLVDSPFGKIPQGWEVKKLSELVSTQYGYTESATNEPIGPKYVRGMDINKSSYIDWDSVPYCKVGDEDKTRFDLSIGDVMVIRMADPGKVGIVEKEVDAIFASYLIRLKIQSPKLSPYFLFYFLTSDQYQGYVTGASTGTTRRSASAGVITDTEMIIPHNDIRQRFEKEVATLRHMLNNLLDRNTILRRTRDLLLPKLISGEIEVLN